MSEPAAAHRQREFGPWMAAAAAFLYALACASGIAGLGDTDPYRHLAYAHALWISRFALHGFPFLPFTTLGTTGVDLWWGFHLFLIPFSGLGVIWGARIAGACIAALATGGLAWLLRRLGQRHGALFALAPWAFSYSYAFRGHLARPGFLTLPLILFGLAAGAGELPAGFALAAAFAHGLLHLSSPLSPFYVLLGLTGARLAGAKGSSRALLWSIGGLGLAFLLRPDRALYLPVAFLLNVDALGILAKASRFGGQELLALPLRDLFFESGAGFALLAISVAAGFGRERAGSRPLRFAAALALVVTTLLTLRTARFLEYGLALIALTAGLYWPKDGLRGMRARVLVGAATLALIVLAIRNVRMAGEEGSLIGPPALYEGLAKAVRAEVPPGSMLFTDDVFRTGAVYASLPEYRYIVMADPALLLTASPIDYYRWSHAVHDGTFCDAPSCPGARASPRLLARAIASFGADWIITSEPARISPMVATMLRAPQLYKPVYAAQAGEEGYVLWHLEP